MAMEPSDKGDPRPGGMPPSAHSDRRPFVSGATALIGSWAHTRIAVADTSVRRGDYVRPSAKLPHPRGAPEPCVAIEGAPKTEVDAVGNVLVPSDRECAAMPSMARFIIGDAVGGPRNNLYNPCI